jgi:cytosine/adenosine deaminase-related metal-dependent hydrolase
MRDSADLARELGVSLHTHLAETRDEEDYCLERFGKRPVPYAESVGWLGPDVWFAHAVHMSPTDLDVLAGTGTGVAHCPTSNMRLGSGVAPLAGFLDRGVPVGLGVDGSASNDGSDLIAEARQALLVSRLARALERSEEPMTDVRTALRTATRGGAAVLGRSDIGSLEPGKAADAAIFRIDGVSMAGAGDPVAALLLCAPPKVDRLVVHGRVVVDDGALVDLDLAAHLERHRRLSADL